MGNAGFDWVAVAKVALGYPNQAKRRIRNAVDNISACWFNA